MWDRERDALLVELRAQGLSSRRSAGESVSPAMPRLVASTGLAAQNFQVSTSEKPGLLPNGNAG
jgi:hypothetical protein